LEGRSLAIVARYTPWRVTLSASAGRLLLSRTATDADATLTGTPFALLSMTREDPQEFIRRGDVHIEGDGVAAGGFQELALLLRPDLERELVPRAEAKQFLEEVDALRESVDRVAARVARLEAGS